MNTSLKTIIFNPKEVLGILDLRLMGYYNYIKQGIVHQNLSTYCRFELADTLCEQFNIFVNTMKKREKEEIQENVHGYIKAMKKITCQIEKYERNI